MSKLFERISFGRKIVCKVLIYAFIMIAFLLINTVVSNTIELDTNLLDSKVWDNVWSFASSFSFWGVEIYIAVVIGLSLFYSEVSENLGLEVLNNFFTGKYHNPIEEERIFMFLDMKSSTAIAEKFGSCEIL